MKKHLISVVMSVYNSEKWLRESIESVLCQSYSNFEFVIINDGSEDNSKKILEEYSKKDDRIKVFHQKNKGLTASLNEGVKKSNGEYIARLDADDVSLSDRLKIQLEEIERKKLDLIASNFTEIDHQGSKINFYDIRNKEGEIIKHFLGGNSLFPHSSVMFKKKAFLEVGGYDIFFKKSQDIDLWLRWYEKKFKIGFCENESPMILLRKHEKSITYNQSDDVYTCLAILNHYSRKNNLIECTKIEKNGIDNLILNLKNNNIYKIISFKMSIRFILKNFFNRALKLSFLSLINIARKWPLVYFKLYLSPNIKLYEKLFNQLIKH